MIRTDINGHVGERNRGDEEVSGRYGAMGRNAKGQMLVEMAVVSTYFRSDI